MEMMLMGASIATLFVASVLAVVILWFQRRPVSILQQVFSWVLIAIGLVLATLLMFQRRGLSDAFYERDLSHVFLFASIFLVSYSGSLFLTQIAATSRSQMLLRPLRVVSSASLWLMLSYGVSLLDGFTYAWLVFYALAIAITIAAKNPNKRLWDRVTTGLLTSCIVSFLLTVRLLKAVLDAVFNADQIFVLLVGANVLLFLFWLIGYAFGRIDFQKILYLRKFGESELSTVVNKSIRRIKPGLTTQMLTLDDSEFAPSTANPAALSQVGLAVVLLIAPLAGLLYGVQANFDWLFGVAEARIGGGVLMIAIRILLTTASACLVLTGVLFSLTILASIPRQRARLETPADVEAYVKKLLPSRPRRLYTLYRPQVVVVSTSDEVWQKTVSRFLENSQANLMDLSNPSDALDWELDQVRRDHLDTTIFVVRDEQQATNLKIETGASDDRVVTKSTDNPLLHLRACLRSLV